MHTSSHTAGTASGTLYGIGVGPGSPDLLTLRAVSVLRSVRVVLAAASPKNEHSLALSIAAPHLPKEVETLRLDFPMTRDRNILAEAWSANARSVAAVLREGRDAAFLTLGDPLVYSTFGYLMRRLSEIAPECPVEVVPGITSYQEAAAKTRTVLCEGEENLLILSGINSEERLRSALDAADSAVILKSYRNFPLIAKTLRQQGKDGHSHFVSRLGLDGELTLRGLANAPQSPHYLSLILVPPQRKEPLKE